jgi:hypothetical protein
MVKSRTYLGEAHQGAITKPGAHPPIVSRAEWEAAQPQAGAPARRSGSLLSGVLSCGSCGHPLGRAGSAYYGCRARRSEGVCPSPVTVRIARADSEVERVFLEWAARQDVAFSASRRTVDVESALAQLEASEAELAAYRDANLVSVIGQAAYVAGLRERAAVVDGARRRLAAAQTANAVPQAHYDVASSWPGLTTAERRLLIASVFETIVVAPSRGNTRRPVGERLRYVWHDASEDKLRLVGA